MNRFRTRLIAAVALTLVVACAALAALAAPARPANASLTFVPLIVGPTPAPDHPYRYVQGSAQCEPNAGVSYYKGEVRDREGRLQNAVCVHVAFFGPRNTKCSGCDGVGDGQWGFAPVSGPAPAGIPVEIFIVPCPANLPPGGQSGDWGDLTPQSDKWLFTTDATSMQCSGITFQEN